MRLLSCPKCNLPRPPGSYCPADGAFVPDTKQQQAGEYVLEERLGKGGMGEVWRGEQPQIEKKVAIKLLNHHLSSDPTVVARFQNEARAVNKIDHPNIVDIFAFGKLSDGRPYFVMELLTGKTLKAYLKERPLFGYKDLLAIFEQILSALAAAHEKGVIHRDLKPDNIFLVLKEGQAPFIKILDFGIAKMTTDLDAEELTRTGAALGTAHYMAPEQCRGEKPIDHRADIYALGVILYLVLTGRLPCCDRRDTFLEALHKQQVVIPVPPSEAAGDRKIPAALDLLILKMLEKDKAKRPSRCADILDELKSAVGQLTDSEIHIDDSSTMKRIPILIGSDSPTPIDNKFVDLASHPTEPKGDIKTPKEPSMEEISVLPDEPSKNLSRSGEYYAAPPSNQHPIERRNKKLLVGAGLVGALLFFVVFSMLWQDPAKPTPNTARASATAQAPATEPAALPDPKPPSPTTDAAPQALVAPTTPAERPKKTPAEKAPTEKIDKNKLILDPFKKKP